MPSTPSQPRPRPGHDHDGFGVDGSAAGGRTTTLNAAQEGLLRVDKHGGGCAWVFDVPAMAVEAEAAEPGGAAGLGSRLVSVEV